MAGYDSGLTGGRATIVDDPRDSLKPATEVDHKKDPELGELTAWVMNRVNQWRDHRRSNYEGLWNQYERLWRGLWAAEDKNKKSERSTLITPGLGEAVENIVAEVEEAVFGRGDFFDIKAELADSKEMSQVTDQNKAHLKEDLSRSDFTSNVGEALINAAVYGSGVGEIIVETFTLREIEVAAPQQPQLDPNMPPAPPVRPEAKVTEKEVSYACLQSVNPRNFLIDPTARTVNKALGVAIEEYVGSHLIRKGQKDGDYRDVEIGTSAGDTELGADRQLENEYVHDKVKIVRYYGLVPRQLLFPAGRTVDLSTDAPAEPADPLAEAIAALPKEESEAKSGEKSVEPIDGEMVEAIVFIANDGTCIKAIESPYLMKDRPVVAFPWDIVPGRFWGRGVCEKGIVPQKVMDAELRARIDALAYVTAPMMAMDASRLPRGFSLVVKPGKSILTHGDPKSILMPIQFGQLEQSTFNHSQQLDQMIQRATGSLDVIALAQRGGDARPGAVSMMLSGIVKRHKRTLMGFIDRFFVPALTKIMWRNMQFYPERYTPLNWTFVASSSMGILQREYETQNLTALMQTMEPQSKEYKMLLMAVVSNTGLTQRAQIVDMLDESIAAAQAMEQQAAQAAQDPANQGMQAQLQQASIQLEIAEKQAKIAELNARTQLQNAKARNEQLEPMFRQMDIATKGIYSTPEEQQANEFDRRMQFADRILKAKDIQSNERIAHIQSGASVKAEAVKSFGSVASEKVRAHAQKHVAHKEGHAQVLTAAHESAAQVLAARHSADGQARAAAAKQPTGPKPLQGRQGKVIK
jgi:hypothetical protein